MEKPMYRGDLIKPLAQRRANPDFKIDHCVLLLICAALIALLPTASQAQPSRSSCRDAADCNFAGSRDLKAGRMEAAEDAFLMEVCFAWQEGETATVVRAHNNLSLLALHRGEPLQARFWAGVALKIDFGSQAAQHNARQADEAVARLPPGQGVTGTYWHRWGDAFGDEVAIQELPGNRIRFELHAVKVSGAPCHVVDYNIGFAEGEAALTGRVAAWEMRDWGETCRLRFSFGPDEVTIEQDGGSMDCGFGHAVYADGTYRRTSRQPPRFRTPGE
jgi:hypothetical protein